MGLAYIIAIGVGGWTVGQGQLSVGQLVTMITYLGELVWPLFAIGTLFNTLERGRASYDRINALLAEQPAWLPAPQNRAVPTGDLAVKIDHFAYPDGKGMSSTTSTSRFPRGLRSAWSAQREVGSRPCCGCWSVTSTTTRGPSQSPARTSVSYH